MNKTRLAAPFEIIDGLELIKKQRKNIEEYVKRNDFKFHPSWQWMTNWLQKTDEQHLQKLMSIENWTSGSDDYDPEQDSIDNDYCCAICFKPKRYLLFSSFSFCDEYGCGIHICRECAMKIGNLAKKMPKERIGKEKP